MDDQNYIPPGRKTFPPLSPDLVLCVPNLADLILSTIDAIEAGMDPAEAANQVASQLYDIVTARIDRYAINVLSIHDRFDPGRLN